MKQVFKMKDVFSFKRVLLSHLMVVTVVNLMVVNLFFSAGVVADDLDKELESVSVKPEKPNEEYLKAQRLQSNLQKLESFKKLQSMRESHLVAIVSKILNDDPRNLQALNALGAFYLNKGQMQMADIIFVRALKWHPKNSSLHNNRGVVALKKGDKKEAIAHFQNSLKYRYSNYFASANLGALYLDSYEYDLSLDYLSLAYSRAKSYLPKFHHDVLKIGNNYGVALSWNKNFKKAQSVFHEIIGSKKPNVELLLNYAILAGEDLNNKRWAFKLLSRADMLNQTRRYTGKIKAIRSYFSKSVTRKKKRP